MDRLNPRGPVLVLAPHPDDESLGCGLLLASLWAGGGRAHVACLTDGAASHPASRTHPPARLAALRRAEMREAVARLGGAEAYVTFFDLPDAALHRVAGPGENVARRVARLVDALSAATLVAPSRLDPHCDHEAGADAAVTVAAMRPCLRLVFYPVWSRWRAGGTVPLPEGARALAFHDPARLPAKRAAIDAHASQAGRVIRDDPEGFAMPEGFAAMFGQGPEPYFEMRP